MGDAEAVLLQWVTAFQARDLHAVLACYDKDAVNHQVAAGPPEKGHDALRAGFEAFFNAFPDSYSHIENILEDGEWAAWEWNGGGTFSGPFLGFEPTGKRYSLRGCGFFHIQAGKIVLQRGYWDKQTWFSQIGIPVGVAGG